MTPLRQRMIDAMVLRGFAARTQETYLSAVGQAAKHHHRSPALLTGEQVQAYLLYLLQERQRSRSTVNITSCALRFLVCDVLGHPSSTGKRQNFRKEPMKSMTWTHVSRFRVMARMLAFWFCRSKSVRVS